MKVTPALTREIVTFGVVGAIGAGTAAAIYIGLVLVGFHYVAASLTAWVIGVFVGYALNRRFTFNSRTKVSRSLPRVVGIYILQQAIGLGGIAILVEAFGLGPIPAYFVMVPLGMAFSFVAMKTIGFR